MLSDLLTAFRSLRKRPLFACVAVLTLALGLSANITIFGIMSFMCLKPLPVKDSDRLVYLSRPHEKISLFTGSSWADYQDMKREVGEMEDMLAVQITPAHVALPGLPADRTWIELVSGNYFSMLGIQPGLGRLFLPGEGEKPGADQIVVVAHSYWVAKLGRDPQIVGKHLLVNGHPLTVVGVAPETFTSAQWAMLPSLFVPATVAPSVFPDRTGMLDNHSWFAFKLLGRLKPGATLKQAEASARVAMARLDKTYRPTEKPSVMRLLQERLSRPEPGVASSIPIIAAVFLLLVGMVLLIACANVANLLFARAAERRRELGIRAAVGASRWQLIRQLLVESLVLSLLAGVIGYFISAWMSPLLSRLSPQGDIPTQHDAGFDFNVLWYTFGASLVAGIAAGLAPSLKASSFDVLPVIRGSEPDGGKIRHRFRSALVVFQVAFCVVVLVCGSLFVKSLRWLSSADLGFRRSEVLVASLDLNLQGYEPSKIQPFVERLEERITKLPQVYSVSHGTTLVFGNQMDLRSASVAGEDMPGDKSDRDKLSAGTNRVGPNYFETLGISLLEGRVIGKQDTASSPRVAVVNQTFARKLWPGKSALGKSFRLEGGNPIEVVGVVRDGKYIMMNETPSPFVFLPFEQNVQGSITLYVHHGGGAAALASALRQVVAEQDPALPIYGVRSLEDHIDNSALGLMPLRMGAFVAGAQGLLGLLLAVMGIYGVVAYSVSLRTKEIGVRVALGARKRDVLLLVMGGSMRLTAAGLVVGLLLAAGIACVLGTLLYNLNPFDPVVFAGVPLLIFGVSCLACYMPARRAVKINPIEALRAE